MSAGLNCSEYHDIKATKYKLTNKEAWTVYYTVIKHDSHSRTEEKCRKLKLQVNVLYISWVFLNVQSVLTQCNTQLRLLHFALWYRFYTRKTIKHAFFYVCTLTNKTLGFDQSEHTQCPIYILFFIYLFIQGHPV